LIYAINPYPTDQGKLTWLANGNRESKEKHDLDAYDEHARKIKTLLQSDGYINLCDVIDIRSVVRGSAPADRNVDVGPQVDFHEDVVDSQQDDGTTEEFDDNRTFELVLNNNLIIRLQSYNKATKKEWMNRLNDIVRYWKLRTAADIELLKMVRHTNLEELQIDEEMESFIGQYARKWEVTRAQASPELHHMCGISCCRTITVSLVPDSMGIDAKSKFSCLAYCSENHAGTRCSCAVVSSSVAATSSSFRARCADLLERSFRTLIASGRMQLISRTVIYTVA